VYPIGALYVCPISVGGRDSVGQYFPEDTWVYIYIYYIHPELRIGDYHFRLGKGAGGEQ